MLLQVPSIVLGLVGLVVGFMDGSGISVGLGATLLVSGVLAASPKTIPKVQLAASLGLVCVLTGLVAYHGYSILAQEESQCGCLRALGDPNRSTILLLLAPCMLLSGWAMTLRVHRADLSIGLLLLCAIALGVFVAWKEAESRVQAPAPVQEQEPEHHQPAVLIGLDPSGSASVDTQQPEAKEDEESASAAWRIVFRPPPGVSEIRATFDPEDSSEEADGIQVRQAESGELFLDGTGEPSPQSVYVEADGALARVLPIAWQVASRQPREGTVTWPEDEDEASLYGLVVDGLGKPVPGVPLVFRQEMSFSGLGKETRRRSLVLDGEYLAHVCSDSEGRFEVSDWPLPAVSVSTLSSAWDVLRDEPIAAARKAAERRLRIGQFPVGSELRIPVGRVAVSLLRLELPNGELVSPNELVRTGPVRLTPPATGALSPRGFVGEAHLPITDGARLVTKMIVPDSSIDFAGTPAGDITVRAAGFKTTTASLLWSTAAEPTASVCVLESVRDGARLPLKLSPGTPLMEWGGTRAFIPIQVSDRQTGDSFQGTLYISSGGAVLSSAFTLPPGQYLLKSPLFVQQETVRLEGEPTPAKSVEIRPHHVIEVQSPDGGRELTTITFTADRIRGGPTASPTDGFFGVEWLLLSRKSHQALYALPVSGEVVHVLVRGPGIKTLHRRLALSAEGRTVLKPEALPSK